MTWWLSWPNCAPRQIRAAQFESQLAATAPGAIYAAYLKHELDLKAATARGAGWQMAGESLYRERRRLETTRPADWAAGLELLAELRTCVGAPQASGSRREGRRG